MTGVAVGMAAVIAKEDTRGYLGAGEVAQRAAGVADEDAGLRGGGVGAHRPARVAEGVGVAALVHERLDHVLPRVGEARVELERLDPLLHPGLEVACSNATCRFAMRDWDGRIMRARSPRRVWTLPMKERTRPARARPGAVEDRAEFLDTREKADWNWRRASLSFPAFASCNQVSQHICVDVDRSRIKRGTNLNSVRFVLQRQTPYFLWINAANAPTQ